MEINLQNNEAAVLTTKDGKEYVAVVVSECTEDQKEVLPQNHWGVRNIKRPNQQLKSTGLPSGEVEFRFFKISMTDNGDYKIEEVYALSTYSTKDELFVNMLSGEISWNPYDERLYHVKEELEKIIFGA